MIDKETMDKLTKDDAASLFGDYNVTLKCATKHHADCGGMWTQYPDRDGKCECYCHPWNHLA